jgi:hypothetical protein
MGFSHSFIAVQGLEPARALEALEMEVAEIWEPDEAEFSGILMGELPDGWLLLLCDGHDGAFKGKLSQLAAFGPAVACGIEEHVMYSEARGYEAGSEVWRVIRDCEKGRYALEVSGNPPPQLDSIFEGARAEQGAEGGEEGHVDMIFEVPPKLVESICGYMLGEEEPEGFRYAELRKIGSADTADTMPKGRGLLARLFGRG